MKNPKSQDLVKYVLTSSFAALAFAASVLADDQRQRPKNCLKLSGDYQGFVLEGDPGVGEPCTSRLRIQSDCDHLKIIDYDMKLTFLMDNGVPINNPTNPGGKMVFRVTSGIQDQFDLLSTRGELLTEKPVGKDFNLEVMGAHFYREKNRILMEMIQVSVMLDSQMQGRMLCELRPLD